MTVEKAEGAAASRGTIKASTTSSTCYLRRTRAHEYTGDSIRIESSSLTSEQNAWPRYVSHSRRNLRKENGHGPC